MIEVVRVPILSDNYVWLLNDAESGDTVVVDPGEAQPVLDAAAARGWTIRQIWNTHWHRDHVGGNVAIKAATGCTIAGPAAEADKIGGLDRLLREGDTVAIGEHCAEVLEVPAHTGGHIAYHFAEDRMAFVGDTLFAMGCGRLFEGTAEQMWRNMQRFAAWPDATQIFCAHEYTASNGRFAARAEPGNAAIRERMIDVTRLRDQGEATIPTTIALERATNPFMRAPDAATLAQLRADKDAFRG
jgi:hydroxyacylglutathione hydrolase